MTYLKKVALSAVIFTTLFSGVTVFAAGNIVNSSKYSQFLDIDLDSDGTEDFINWLPDQGGATVTDTAITGYIWGESVGWIRLNPTQSGVTNSCSGILGGYAWGENTGWINFAPTQATGSNQPKINTTTGAITGSVWSQNYGWITLNSGDGSHPGLTTTWTGCTDDGGEDEEDPAPPIQSGGPGPSPVPTPPPNPVPPPVNPDTLPNLPWDNEPDIPLDIPPATPSDVPPSSTPPSSPNNAPGPGGSGSSGQGLILRIGSSVGSLLEGVVDRISKNRIAIVLSETIEQALPVAAPVVGAIGLVSSIPGLVTRFGNLILALFLRRKKTRGVVFDSRTKQPLDPAYVSVVDAVTGQEVFTAITDMEGRFGLVLSPGSYRIIANKTHYQFPSVQLAGKMNDEVYDRLYFGDTFTVTDEQVTTMNIPMDATDTDWNQEEKKRMNLMRYFLENPRAVRVLEILFVIGFILSIVAIYYYPAWWNFLLASLYVVVALIQSAYGSAHPGKITYQGSPLAFAIVRVFNANLNREVAHKVTSELGGYFILVPKADYYVTIEQKNTDGTYTKIFTSPVLTAHHGVINKSFDI